MRNYLILLSAILFFSCSSKKISNELASFPLEVPEQNSLMSRWENKPVLKTLLIDNMEADSGWQVSGIGEMSYTTERFRDGKQSLRFLTSLRDEEHYRKNRTEWGSFSGTQGGNSHVVKNFDTPQDWSEFNRISFWVYVHPSDVPTYCLYLNINNTGTIYNATTPRNSHFIQDLKPGTWNHVLFEMHHILRDSVTGLVINQMLIGHNPEEKGIVTYDIDQLELELVGADQYEGWNVAPEKFSFSHVGYRPGDPKIALVGDGAGDSFQLIDANETVVFSGDIREVNTMNGLFHQLDFSDFNTEGIYRLRSGSLESDPFPINRSVWLQPVFKAINSFFCLRCGFNVPGIHKECHKDWQGFVGEEKRIINGGWHDAGDLSQGAWRTSMAAFSMMANIVALKEQKADPELIERIESELAWGVDWLLKTRFGNGYHMSFSVMRIYTDNKVGTIDDVVSPASNVPWENFLASAVFCKAAQLLNVSNPELAAKARTASIEDWEAAANSKGTWDKADYREASWGATSSMLLGNLTGEEKYREKAREFGNLVVKCQEQTFQDGIPITGYFYENTDRQRVIHNLHAAFEEAPLIALAMLCREFPDHENWMEWYSAAVLHSEYFMKRGSQIASPYDLLPNSVWKESDILKEKVQMVREDMLRQFKDGTPLKPGYALRTFPIYRDGLFHGNTNVHLSSTWALAEAASLRNDSEGMLLVGKQLEWVLGHNPFGQSLMYGVGYNFAPHFAYCLKNIVGSLPVGMDCMSGDMPHWSATNTATSKEIWVEPASRFLGAVSIYNSYKSTQGAASGNNVQIYTEHTQADNGLISVTITLTGSDKHTVEIKSFNIKENPGVKEIDLSGNKTEKIQIEMQATDLNKPYVAVINIDDNQILQKEITGSFIKALFPGK